MSNIVNYIKGVVEGFDLPFYYDNKGVANVKFDKATFPIGYLMCIESADIDLGVGCYSESADCLLFFLEKATRIDFDGTENQAKIDDMKQYALYFIKSVLASNQFKFVGDKVTMEMVFDYDDANTTGVVLKFKLKESGAICITIPDFS